MFPIIFNNYTLINRDVSKDFQSRLLQICCMLERINALSNIANKSIDYSQEEYALLSSSSVSVSKALCCQRKELEF